jgi:hypothetical protein
MANIIRLHSDPHEQIEKLLPWYVTGQIEPADRVKVEAHLAECIGCQAELQFERRLSGEVADLPLDMAPGWAELRRQLAVPLPYHRRAGRMRAAVRRAIVRPGKAAWFLGAQAAIVLVAAVLIAPIERPAPYRTLGSGPAAAGGNIIVIFRPDTSEQDMRHTLVATGARLVDGPTSAAAYVLRVAPSRRAAALVKLRTQSDIVLAQPIDSEAPL